MLNWCCDWELPGAEAERGESKAKPVTVPTAIALTNRLLSILLASHFVLSIRIHFKMINCHCLVRYFRNIKSPISRQGLIIKFNINYLDNGLHRFHRFAQLFANDLNFVVTDRFVHLDQFEVVNMVADPFVEILAKNIGFYF